MELSVGDTTLSRVTAAGSVTDTARRWVFPGLVAGLVFLAVAMVGGALSSTAWSMPEAIAAAFGLGAPGQPFGPASVAAGVLVHLITSVGLGALFTVVARRFRLRGRVLLIGAVIFMMVESGVSIWGVLHTVLPSATFTFFLAAVPLWASFVGRILFGVVLGLLLAGQALPERSIDPS